MNSPPKRIVIATIGSLGDLHPYMAVALALQARGHEVALAAPSSYRDRIAAAGLTFAPLRPDPPLQNHALYARVLHAKDGPEFAFRNVLMPAIGETYEDLHRIAVDVNPDLLVSNPAVFAAPLLAEKLDLSWASTVLAPRTFFSAYEPPDIPGLPATIMSESSLLRPFWGRSLRAQAKRTTSSWTLPIDDLRRRLGLPPAAADPLYEGQHSPSLVIAMFSRVLGAPQPDWPAPTRQTGFAFYDSDESASRALDPELEGFLDGGSAPIVFSLGSTAVNAAGNFYADSVGAACALGKRALLLIGKEPANRASLPQPLPAGVAAFEYAPYSAVFSRALAIVHQGGIGTTAQALRAGVPSLIVPFAFDQPDNAARVARLGAAKVLFPTEYNAFTAAGALQSIIADAAAFERSKDIACQIAAEQGADAACAAIEGVLRSAARRS